MLAEFIEASVNFTTGDVGKMYAIILVVLYSIAFFMFKSATAEKND